MVSWERSRETKREMRDGEKNKTEREWSEKFVDCTHLCRKRWRCTQGWRRLCWITSRCIRRWSFLMQCCAWQHTALSLLILLNEHSTVVDRSPFAAAVPAFSPLLCLLFCVVLTDLGRLSLTPLGRPLPMMMCISKRYFPRNTRRPPFEDSRDYEDSGLDRDPNTTEFVHVSDWILALWIPRMKYVVTSLPSFFLALTSAIPHLCISFSRTQKFSSESWGTKKGTSKTFKPTLFVPFRWTQKFHHNKHKARAYINSLLCL